MSDYNESIVLVGGGGGVYRIAKFLKYVRGNITTVQTIFDHGGHSGELRDERGVLPPGDIRQAILALADDGIEAEFRALLTHRFAPKNGSSLDHATVGNILLTAVMEITGSLPGAINVLSRWFRVKGKVLPVSLENAELVVQLSDGKKLKGEGKIDKRSIKDHRKIVGARLEPCAGIYPLAYEAIVSAKKIVFCPGDLYTSIVPNVLVQGFKEAVAKSKAKLIFIVNIMTKRAEADGFSASEFVRIVLSYLERKSFDFVICNKAPISNEMIKKYRVEGARPVLIDLPFLSRFSKKVILQSLADETGGLVRHNDKIGSVIANL